MNRQTILAAADETERALQVGFRERASRDLLQGKIIQPIRDAQATMMMVAAVKLLGAVVERLGRR